MAGPTPYGLRFPFVAGRFLRTRTSDRRRIGLPEPLEASRSSDGTAKGLDTRGRVRRMMETLDHVKRTQRESP